MAGLNSDYIQQQLLDQSIAMNDNLSEMRKLLLDIEKNTKDGGGSGSGGSGGNNDDTRRRNRNDRNNNTSFSKALKDIFGESKHIGSTILGNNGSIQNTVGAFSTSARVLQNSLGKLPGPIGLAANAFLQIVQVGGMVYEYLNEQLNMYNQLNSAGITLADGMITARKGSSSAFLSLNEFSKVLEKNSDSIAAMDGQYGDGVEHFGKLLNTVQLAQQKIGLYGVSQQQLADLAAKNYKYERMFAGQAQLRNMSETQSTEKFVGTMTYLSKTVGKSVDELLSKFNDMSNNLDTGLTQDALMNYYGLSEDKAAQVTKSMNSIFSSMGEAGAQLQKLNSSKLQMGMLPEEFNNQFTQMYTDRLSQLQASGITDEKVLRRAMSQYVQEHQRQLDEEIRYQSKAGNTTAAAWLQQLKNLERILNDPKNQPNPVIENFTNRFNLWIGQTFTEPFNAFYARITESAASYLTKLADRSDNAWDFVANLFSDGIKNFENGMTGMFGGLLSIPNKLLSTIFGESYNKVNDAFVNFMGELVQIPIRLGKLIWEFFAGDDADIDKAGKELGSSVHRVFSSVTNVFDKLSELDFNYDDMKNRITTAFESMKNSIGSWWDRAKGWFSDDETPEQSKPVLPTQKQNTPPTSYQPKTSGTQKVTAPPEFTKPIKIEQADQTVQNDAQTQQNSDQNDAIQKALSSILNTLENQGQNTNQIPIILRQIADNTEPARNV